VQGRGKFENQKLNAFRIVAKADRFPKRLLVYYRFANTEPYTLVPMNEDVSNEPSGMKAFSVIIEAKSMDAVLDYYIVAENAGTVAFVPSTYMNKPYMVKLSDLNK